MRRYLSQCDIPVEIYRYDPKATDDLYEDFRRRWLQSDDAAIKKFGNYIPDYRPVLGGDG